MNQRSRRRLIVPAAPLLATLIGAALIVVTSSSSRPVTKGHPLALGARTPGGKAGAASPVARPALTPAVPGTSPTLVKGATDLGPVTGSNRMEVTLALPLRDRPALNLLFKDEYTRSSPGYHHFLTPAGFDARFAPTQVSVSTVTNWATKDGLDVVSVSSNRTLVQLSGTTAALSTALGTSFDAYRAKGGVKFVTPSTTALLPAAVKQQISSVVGLSTLGRIGVSAPALASDTPAGLSTASTTSPSASGSGGLLGSLLGGLLGGAPTSAGAPTSGSTPTPGSVTTTSTFAPVQASPVSNPAATPAAPGYGPAQVARIYNAPTSAQGAGQTVANIDEGSLGQVRADLSSFETDAGLPHVPVTVVPVGAPSSDTASQTEWALDAEYSTGLAPDVSRLILYDAHSLSDTDVLSALNSWVTQDQAKEAGLSGGECESVAKADGVLGATDDVLAQAVAQGQTLFVATGDRGAFCEPVQGTQRLGVQYPASSQYAVAVGGTTVQTTAPLSESAWPQSGGGVSTVEAEAPYQRPVIGPSAGRSVPDVSLDSDPATGFECIVDGRREVVGGTSAATQAWVGIWARAEEAHGGSLGFANVAIYAASPSAFHDVIGGSNGFYSAGPGYDLVTGRGTPNIAAFIAGA